MTVLRPIIQYPALSVLTVRHDLSPGHASARKLVGSHHARSDALCPQQLLHQADSRFCTAVALNQDIEHGAVLVRGSQKLLLSAAEADRNLMFGRDRVVRVDYEFKKGNDSETERAFAVPAG